MTGRVRGLIEIYDTGADVRFEVSFKRGAAIGDGCEMTGADEYYDFVSVQSLQIDCCAHTVVVILE